MNKIEIRTDDNELYATLDWNPKFAGLPEVLGSILHKSAANPDGSVNYLHIIWALEKLLERIEALISEVDEEDEPEDDDFLAELIKTALDNGCDVKVIEVGKE